MINAGKYLSGIIVVILSVYRELGHEMDKYILRMSFVATIYSYCWDLTMDWGLLKTKNLLRERIKYSKYFYYFAMVLNLILRCVWTITLFPSSYYSDFKELPIGRELLGFIFAVLEIYRRF